jgi:hypothetical protein
MRKKRGAVTATIKKQTKLGVLSDDDEQGDGATQGETNTRRKSFRKIVGGEEDYFVNVETNEAVWYVIEDGEEVTYC